MHSSGTCKCLHCAEFFVPDPRNRGRQCYCVKPECAKASKTASQRAWRQKPENAEYFRGAANVARVQAWRQAHPGYWRRKGPQGSHALQEISHSQPADSATPTVQDDGVALQDLVRSQPPVLVGLVAQFTGSALQEDIAAMLQTLHSRGRAISGLDASRPAYAKTPPQPPTPAARAVAV
jgi:hypothetical protein